MYRSKGFKSCKIKRSEERRVSYVNLDATSTDHYNSLHSRNRHTNLIKIDNNTYEKLHRENGADDHSYVDVSSRNKAIGRSDSGNETGMYEIVHAEDFTDKNQNRDVAARIVFIEAKEVNLYQPIQTECVTIGHKIETVTNTIEKPTSTVEVSDVSGNKYEKLQKPSTIEHYYSRTIADGVTGFMMESGGDIPYDNLPL